MSTLLVHLPSAAPGLSTQYSYTLTTDGHIATRQGHAHASTLPEPSRPGGEVVAVVPVHALSWQRVTLPPGVAAGTGPQASRLRAVLEGLLEDKLLDDPAQLHFALEPLAKPGTSAWVAVCDRAWLRQHLQALEQAGRTVARVVPEFAPGPTASGHKEVCAIGNPADPHMVLLDQGEDHSLAVLPLSPAVLELAGLRHASHAAPDTENTLVRADPAIAELAERTLGRPVVLHGPSDRALEAARGAWDLAQFDLASTSQLRALRRVGSLVNALLHAPQWRAARVAAVLAVLAHVAGLNVWAWQERAALAGKHAAVRQTLTQTFPQVQVVVDAPVQMEREVALLRQASGSVSARDLEPMMAALAQALPDGRLPSALEYSSGELRLRGITLAPDEEAIVTQKLQAAGYTGRPDDGSWLLRLEGSSR